VKRKKAPPAEQNFIRVDDSKLHLMGDNTLSVESLGAAETYDNTRHAEVMFRSKQVIEMSQGSEGEYANR
jgi:hypothetical protein